MKIKFINNVLNIFEKNIIPITTKNVNLGNKIFGAAIINKNDFSLVVSGTNNEIKNPLFHGEISTINNFFKIQENKRPSPKNCIFISSHEPCSLCLSAITWCGFNNFYYLFSYNDTKRKYKIPHDLKILKEVFNIKNGKYNKKNFYWESYDLQKMIDKLNSKDKEFLTIKINKIKFLYSGLSDKYQLIKKNVKIPLK